MAQLVVISVTDVDDGIFRVRLEDCPQLCRRDSAGSIRQSFLGCHWSGPRIGWVSLQPQGLKNFVFLRLRQLAYPCGNNMSVLVGNNKSWRTRNAKAFQFPLAH